MHVNIKNIVMNNLCFNYCKCNKAVIKTTTVQTGNKQYYKINHNKVYNLALKFSTQLKDSEKSLTRK